MTSRAFLLTLVAAFTSGCGHFGFGTATPGSARPDRDVGTAVTAGDFARARVLLEARAACTGSADGGRALLLLTALDLDPRNASRSPAAAAANAVLYLRLPGSPAEGRSLAESLYLIALENVADPVGRAAPDDTGVPRDSQPSAGPEPGTRLQLSASSREHQSACRELRQDKLIAYTPPVLPVRTTEQRIRALERQRDDIARRLRASEDGRRSLEKRLAEVTDQLALIRQILRQ